MLKLTVLYTRPEDEQAFEQHYTGVHLPLVAEMPGLTRFESARCVGTPDGSPAPYHRTADLYFPDSAAMGESFATEQGRRTAADAAGPAGRTGSTVSMLVCALDDQD